MLKIVLVAYAAIMKTIGIMGRKYRGSIHMGKCIKTPNNGNIQICVDKTICGPILQKPKIASAKMSKFTVMNASLNAATPHTPLEKA